MSGGACLPLVRGVGGFGALRRRCDPSSSSPTAGFLRGLVSVCGIYQELVSDELQCVCVWGGVLGMGQLPWKLTWVCNHQTWCGSLPRLMEGPCQALGLQGRSQGRHPCSRSCRRPLDLALGPQPPGLCHFPSRREDGQGARCFAKNKTRWCGSNWALRQGRTFGGVAFELRSE